MKVCTAIPVVESLSVVASVCCSPILRQHILRGVQESGIHTAIETAGNVPWEYMEKVLQHVDLMLHDNKQMDSERHKKWMGVGNKRILENFKKAYETFPNVEFITRTPIIPGINADEEHIRAVLGIYKALQKCD